MPVANTRCSVISTALTGLMLMVATRCALAHEPPLAITEPLGSTQDEVPHFADEQLDFFESKIRPLLAKRCYECHGPDRQESDLRLDNRAMILQGGASGEAAAIAGEVDQSLLVQSIRYTGDYAMPPEEPLPDEEVQLLEEWVRMKMPWPAEVAAQPQTMDERVSSSQEDLWSLQPIRRPEIPIDPDDPWSYSPLDRLIFQKLKNANLAPSPDADRRTWLRRLKADLVGLPVTIEEVEAFLNDEHPHAYAKQVDRLLADPGLGERWGRHWLDVARYADTKGYAFQQDRRYPFAYTYRDYVIRSMNEDKPYDRFVLEQLAADTLDLGENRDPLAALGFITTGRRYNNPHDDIDDRIDVVSRGLLGLTVACARCHDHKYDAIPSEDYYSLYGVFASSEEPADGPLLGTSEEVERYQSFLDRQAQARKSLEQYKRENQERIIEEGRSRVTDYLVLSMHAGDAEQAKREAVAAEVDTDSLSPLYIEKWKNYLVGHRGLDDDPIFSPHVRLRTQTPEEFPGAANSLAQMIRDDEQGEFEHLNPRVREAFLEATPQSRVELARLLGKLFEETHQLWKEKGANDAAVGQLSVEHQQFALVLYDTASPTLLPQQRLRDFLSADENGEADRLEAELRSIEAQTPEALPRAMVLHDRAQPIQPVVFIRGQPGRPGKQVPRQFLALLEKEQRQPFANGSGRRELAEKIIDPQNPLTARVIVNRIWMHHFGAPLVDSPSDFGIRSDQPEQLELLDYLASLLIENDWSLKSVHREILLSHAYRQSSRSRAEADAIDPENRLIWRMNRKVLEFEPLRDSLLATAERLDQDMYGPSESLVDNQPSHRRAIYGTVDRQDLPNLFRVFDFASPDQSIGQRPRTIVPQQALFLMNSPFVIDCAKRLATQHRLDSENAEESIRVIYRQVLAREPLPEEIELAKRLIDLPIEDESATQLSRWEQFCQLLLLTNEFAYID